MLSGARLRHFAALDAVRELEVQSTVGLDALR